MGDADKKGEIVVLGDLHECLDMGIQVAAGARGFRPGLDIPVVQVGDINWHPDRPPRTPPWPIFFCDGNHDFLPGLLELDEPTEVSPNLIYVPRGSVLTLAGYRVGFLGGARSIDREFRIKDEEWWEREELTMEEGMRLRGEKLDLLITHSPPASVVKEMGYADHDYSSVVVQEIWDTLPGRPPIWCGHMHRRFRSGNVTVLGFLDVDVFGEKRVPI